MAFPDQNIWELDLLWGIFSDRKHHDMSLPFKGNTLFASEIKGQEMLQILAHMFYHDLPNLEIVKPLSDFWVLTCPEGYLTFQIKAQFLFWV